MSFLASLPMYAFAETQEADRGGAAKISSRFSETLEWVDTADYADPRLALSMSCWGPINAGAMPPLRVLAQLDYSTCDGGAGALYRSAIVVRGAGPVVSPAGHAVLPQPEGRFAFNEAHSRSGILALREDAKDWPDAVWQGALETGSHRGSVLAVAEGRADFAAIDCMTWHLLQQFEPACEVLRVAGWTAPRLGLPYVCAPDLPDELAREMAAILLDFGALPAQA